MYAAQVGSENDGVFVYPPSRLDEPGENCDQPPMRAVPEWPSFLTHRTVEPSRVSL